MAPSVEAPSVKRASESLLDDDAADPEVCPQMGTMGVEDMRNTGPGPEDDQLTTEVFERPHVARREVAARGDGVPTRRNRMGEIDGHQDLCCRS